MIVGTSTVPPIRLAVLADYLEEGWLSMDLCAGMLLDHLARDEAADFRPARLTPPFRRLATRIPIFGCRPQAFNADRLLNRFVHFPEKARRAASDFDLFHVVDHSYAQLVHALPLGRAGVYCHDLDAFRCLLDPTTGSRPRWFRALARRILTGLQRAAVIFHGSAVVGDQLRQAGLVDEERLVLAPYGSAPEFRADPPARPVELPWTASVGNRPWLLHVGSCIPRKRIDVLLDVAAAVRREVPGAFLVKVGGDWSSGDRDRITRLGLDRSLIHVRGLDRAGLAEAYRRAAVVLVPSEAEGFGLPIIEALACGTRVVASDIPALREVGGPAAAFAPVGDVPHWAKTVATLLAAPDPPTARAARLAWASRFSWTEQARIILDAYRELL